jgi:dTDP-4-amino-4,6-dideoxygalactose transaminase
LIDEEKYGLNSRKLLRMLAKRGIETRPLWQPLDLSNVYKDLRNSSCPVAQSIYRMALTLPSSVGVSREDQKYVIAAIVELIQNH